LTMQGLEDVKKPGAITSIDVIQSIYKTDNMGVNYSLNCLDMFGIYHNKTNPDKFVEPRELTNMMDLFHKAESAGITVDENYVDEVIRCFASANVDHNKWGDKTQSHKLIAMEYKSHIQKEIKDKKIPEDTKTRCDQRREAPFFHVALLDYSGFNYELPAAYKGRKIAKKWFKGTYQELVK